MRGLGVKGKVTSRQQEALDALASGEGPLLLNLEQEADELTEDVMLGAVMFAHDESRKVIGAIIDLAEQAAKEQKGLGHVTRSNVLSTRILLKLRTAKS